VAGISWGTTLALAYAQAHPDRVTEMVLVSVVTTTRAEGEWLTRSMGRVLPAEWERSATPSPRRTATATSRRRTAGCCTTRTRKVRDRAAAAWCAWEDTHVGTCAGHRPSLRYRDPAFRLCFARVVTHYFRHAGFLEDGALLRGAARLAGIPGVMVHGRLDASGPPDVPWQLARVRPGSELVLLDDVGHGATIGAIRTGTDRFAAR